MEELDKNVIIKAQSGDIEAQNTVFSFYAGTIRAVARKYFVLGYEQDDLVQEAQLSLFVALKTFDASLSVPFSAYVRVIAERKIINLIKSAVSKKHAPLNTSERLVGEEYNVLEWGDSVEDAVIQDDMMLNLMAKAKNILSDKENKVLNLYLMGYTISEMADLTHSTNKSVDNTMTRIKNKLKGVINDGTHGTI